jgi:hypothetical protein
MNLAHKWIEESLHAVSYSAATHHEYFGVSQAWNWIYEVRFECCFRDPIVWLRYLESCKNSAWQRSAVVPNLGMLIKGGSRAFV